ncbi:uncharacterized protein P884DRAFT_261451 [Thermothelomyces heterothallicus CBS 202.75]|uniref:uncharacterized protein n=1 Tax=Thermothelomyces heterothallicus CBS 202.75 TaxID=1149848 RepID=UPI0037426645
MPESWPLLCDLSWTALAARLGARHAEMRGALAKKSCMQCATASTPAGDEARAANLAQQLSQGSACLLFKAHCVSRVCR